MKMKNLEVKSYSTKESLLSSILFFILGAILFFNPDGIITVIAYILGGIFVVLGLSKFIMYRRMSLLRQGSILDLASGIVYIAFAVICFAFFHWIETAFRFIAAFYILYIGINRLVFAFVLMKEHYDNAIGGIITASLMILFGVLLCFINVAIKFIGLFIMAYSIMDMIGFILFSGKTGPKEKEEVKEAEIIEEKEIDEEK